MLLFGFLIFPVILAAPNELEVFDYSIAIENNTLISVEAIQKFSDVVNLSGLGIKRIDKRAFENVTNVKFLNLANNSLTVLPRFAFSNLTNLEHLSLVGNNIKNLNTAFVGLKNLKTLDLSKNPIKSLGHGQLYGLNHSVEIITRGNSIKKITSALYDNISPPLPSEEDDDDDEDEGDDDDDDDDDYDDDEDDDILHNIHDEDGRDNYCEVDPNKEGPGRYVAENPDFHVKVCVVQGRVTLLDYMDVGEVLSPTCREIKHDDCCRLYVENFGIETFERGWYQIKNSRHRTFKSISLAGNNITRVTEEMLNDLPETIKTVDLSRNEIRRLERDTMRNKNIRTLYINDNSIDDIEDETFENMRIWKLFVNGNKLNNVKFVETVPRVLKQLCMNRNRIAEVPNFPVWRFHQLNKWYMRNNSITVVRRNALRGLPFLGKLDLSNNRITTLEPGCFRGLRNVNYLRLRNNEIANLDVDLFEGLVHLQVLDLGRNKLAKITQEFRDSLPIRLQVMHLDYNLFTSLETGTFVNVPKKMLNLRGNAITTIAKGSFTVPKFYGLDVYFDMADLSKVFTPGLSHRFFGALFSRLSQLPVGRKGIGLVDLSKNPIRRLENGSLSGIAIGRRNGVYLFETPIEFIHGGLFDNEEK